MTEYCNNLNVPRLLVLVKDKKEGDSAYKTQNGLQITVRYWTGNVNDYAGLLYTDFIVQPPLEISEEDGDKLHKWKRRIL